MCKLSIVMVLMLVSNARARELPSQVDLKAAYCIPIVKDYVSSLTSNIKSISPEAYSQLPPELQELTAKTLSEGTANLRRLQLYLLPRIPYLDLFGLEAATKSGQEDVVRQAEQGKICGAKCQNEFNFTDQPCFVQCIASSLTTRMGTCHDLSWLPF